MEPGQDMRHMFTARDAIIRRHNIGDSAVDPLAQDICVNETILLRAAVNVRAGELGGLRQQQTLLQHPLGFAPGAGALAVTTLRDVRLAAAMASPMPGAMEVVPVDAPGWLEGRAAAGAVALADSRDALKPSMSASDTEIGGVAERLLTTRLPIATPSAGTTRAVEVALAAGLRAGGPAT